MAKYFNPLTDYGFKLLFGREATKEFLIDFLNTLLEGEKKVTDVHFRDKEQTREFQEERGIIYDIYCTSDTGEHFIVEMQNTRQAYFVDRAIYYMSRCIDRQGQKGEWNYKLSAVYGIFFTDFCLDSVEAKLRTDVVMADRDTNSIFSDKMRMTFIQLPLQTKTEDECETDFDKWIFVMRHMGTLSRMPFEAQKKIFAKLADVARIDLMEEPMRSEYEFSLKRYRDEISKLETAKNDGIEEGKKAGTHTENIRWAKELKLQGIDTDTIQRISGLSIEEIDTL